MTSYFSAFDRVIRKNLLPALLGIPSCKTDGEYYQLLSQSIKKGGLAIKNLVETVSHVHETLAGVTQHLVQSWVDDGMAFDHNSHQSETLNACAQGQREILQL